MAQRRGHGRQDRSQHFSDDEEDGGRSKRSRVEHDELLAKERLEDLIVQLGNNSTIEQHETVQNDVHDLSVLLESEIGKFKDAILKVLVACASERPDKLRVYATLIGLINLKNHAFVGEFLEQLVKELRCELQCGNSDWDGVLCAVRFLAELTNHRVVTPASLLQLFNAFLGVTLEEGIPQARSDCFVHLVLASLPWAAAVLAEKHRPELGQLLASVGSYRARRSLAHLRTVQSVAGQEDWIDSLWHQIQSLEKADWKEKCTLRFEAFTGMLLAAGPAGSHSLPAMAPQPHEEGTEYPAPRAVFRLFDYTDVPEDGPALPGEHSIERYLVEEHLSALIACSHRERKDCAKALLNARFGVRVPLSYMIAELALGQMLQLPSSDLLHLFYCSLLIELCKEDSETMPNVVAQATFGLFDRLDAVNAECADRLARWFSYHLSQCKYQWTWTDWTDECLQLPQAHPKLVFLRDTAQLVGRFSYYDQVRKMLGPRLAPLLLHPKQPECVYKYDDEANYSPEVVSCAHRLIDAIRERCTTDRAVEVLNTLPRPPPPAAGGDTGDDAYMLLKVDVFFSTLLFLGSKSFSHSFAALAKFHPVCKALLPPGNRPATLRLLATLYECWRWHEQMLVVLLDKLVKVQLVDCQSVYDWLFGCGSGSAEVELALPRRELSRGYVWDAAASTLAKMCKHRARLAEDWAKAKKRYDDYHERMRSTAAASGSDQQQQQQSMDTDEAAPAAASAAAPATQPPQQQQAELVEEDTPTRDELEAKADAAERAAGELRGLVVSLVRCGLGSVLLAGDGVGEADGNGNANANANGEVGGGQQYLRKLVYDRCLAVLTVHYNDVKPAMRELYSQSAADVKQFCEAFFSLTE